jgi:hypothetical protein
MKHIKLFEQFISEGLSKSEINQIEDYLDKYVDEDALFDMCNDFYTDDDEWHDVKNDLDKADLTEWAISYFKTNGFKLKDIKVIFEGLLSESKTDDLIKKFKETTGVSTWDKVKVEGEKGIWTVVRLWSSTESGGMNKGLSIELTQGNSREHFTVMDDNGELTPNGKIIKKI